MPRKTVNVSMTEETFIRLGELAKLFGTTRGLIAQEMINSGVNEFYGLFSNSEGKLTAAGIAEMLGGGSPFRAAIQSRFSKIDKEIEKELKSVKTKTIRRRKNEKTGA